MPLPYDILLSSLSSGFHVDKILDIKGSMLIESPDLTFLWPRHGLQSAELSQIGITEWGQFTGDISFTLIIKPRCPWEFSGGPMVRTACSHCQGPTWNPWSEIRVPQAVQHGQTKHLSVQFKWEHFPFQVCFSWLKLQNAWQACHLSQYEELHLMPSPGTWHALETSSRYVCGAVTPFSKGIVCEEVFLTLTFCDASQVSLGTQIMWVGRDVLLGVSTSFTSVHPTAPHLPAG